MRFQFTALIGAVLVATLAPITTTARAEGPSQNAAVEGGRSLHVIVAQSEIKSDINPSNLAAATGGGLLGAMIEASADSARGKKAEAAITPIRDAMAGLDADALAINSAKDAFGSTEWFKANPKAGFGKDSSPLGKSAILDAASGKQVAFVEYSYDFSPEFDLLRIVAKIDVANKAVPAEIKAKPEKRVSPRYLAYSTRATTVVALSGGDPGKTGRDVNPPRWAADKAALARAAMKLGFDDLVQLIQKTLALTPEAAKALNDKKNKKITAGGFTGRPQPSNDNGQLIWDNGFIHVVLPQ